VVNILWSDSPLAFVIENKEIAKSYREYFNYLWKTIPDSKKTKNKNTIN